MTISTHILDTAQGRPAAGVRVELYSMTGGKPELVAEKETDEKGRITDMYQTDSAGEITIMKMIFHTGEYFGSATSFFPFVEIYFTLTDQGHYHIPLLISPFGYTTYRGS